MTADIWHTAHEIAAAKMDAGQLMDGIEKCWWPMVPDGYFTKEAHPRTLIVAGRSSIDPDCLVAYLESDTERKRPLWIVEISDGANDYVCGLDMRATTNEKDARIPTFVDLYVDHGQQPRKVVA